MKPINQQIKNKFKPSLFSLLKKKPSSLIKTSFFGGKKKKKETGGVNPFTASILSQISEFVDKYKSEIENDYTKRFNKPSRVMLGKEFQKYSNSLWDSVNHLYGKETALEDLEATFFTPNDGNKALLFALLNDKGIIIKGSILIVVGNNERVIFAQVFDINEYKRNNSISEMYINEMIWR